jgi:hypothetical protein
MEEFEVSSFLPVDVRQDGTAMTLRLVGADGREISIRFAAPLSTQLAAALQQAAGEAADKLTGVPQQKGGAMRLTVREPQTVQLFEDQLSGRLIQIFDQGKPTEMAYAMPASATTALAQQLLAILRTPKPEAQN